MTRVAGPELPNRRPHAQALRAEDRMVLAGARRRAEACRQLPALDAAMTFERVLQVEEEEGPARVEPVDVVVPRAAVVEARVHETLPPPADLDFEVIVDGEAHPPTVFRRHLARGLHPPQRLPLRDRRVPHLFGVPADTHAATDARRHGGVRCEPACDALAGCQGLPHLLECGVDVDGQLDRSVAALAVVGHVASMSACRPPSGSAARDAGTAGLPT